MEVFKRWEIATLALKNEEPLAELEYSESDGVRLGLVGPQVCLFQRGSRSVFQTIVIQILSTCQM